MEGGVHFPDTRFVNGVELKRNGQGIRSLSLLGIHYKLYVAGFYSRLPLKTEEEVLEKRGNDCPLQFEFTFLREFGKKQVRKAWEMQTSHSISYRYEGYDSDIARFIDLLTYPISSGGTITVQIIEDRTVLIFEGDEKGTILSSDFQKAFLSMWFGENAVTEELKTGFLNGALHHIEQMVVS